MRTDDTPTPQEVFRMKGGWFDGIPVVEIVFYGPHAQFKAYNFSPAGFFVRPQDELSITIHRGPQPTDEDTDVDTVKLILADLDKLGIQDREFRRILREDLRIGLGWDNPLESDDENK